MKPGHFSVIRYNPDPGRNEELNIGIVVWDEGNYRLAIDEAAVARVVRENPRLASDALRYLQPVLDHEFAMLGPAVAEQLPLYIQEQRGFPLAFTEPLFTGLDADRSEALDITLNELLDRIVRPRRRGGGARVNPKRDLAKRLEPWLAQQILRPNHFFNATRSGELRAVDFFANSGANIALDTVALAVKDADTILFRADAEAGKIYDICGSNEGLEIIVYCAVPTDEGLADVSARAQKIIGSTGATVSVDLEATVEMVESRLHLHPTTLFDTPGDPTVA